MKRVVVTGLGVISPVGNDVETYWSSLKAGKCGIGYITKFDATDFKVKIAAEVKDFDPLPYMDRNDVRRSDLYSQYAVCAAGQAMADSGIKQGDIDPQRLGVYFSSGIGGIATFENECMKLFEAGPGRISPFFIPMMIENIAAGNIAIKFGAKGPVMTVVTACATSTNSIGEAFRAIKHGYADAVIAGGSEAAVTKMAIAGFTSCMALSKRNDPIDSSIPFDKRRDGFVLGEGAAALVLEEYGHAVSRGAKIYAEIKGYGNTCDAHHITAPHPEAEGAAAAISNALREAEIVPGSSKLYINAHGTSTPLNDKAETAAIKKALGAESAAGALINSTKSMIGHCLGAAGALEAAAAVLSLRDGVVHPTIGYKEADPDCDLDYVPGKARKAAIDAALSTNLGFGGHNACLVFTKIK